MKQLVFIPLNQDQPQQQQNKNFNYGKLNENITDNILLQHSILNSETESSFYSDCAEENLSEYLQNPERKKCDISQEVENLKKKQKKKCKSHKTPKYLIQNFQPEFKNFSFFQESSIEQSNMIDEGIDSNESISQFLNKSLVCSQEYKSRKQKKQGFINGFFKKKGYRNQEENQIENERDDDTDNYFKQIKKLQEQNIYKIY